MLIEEHPTTPAAVGLANLLNSNIDNNPEIKAQAKTDREKLEEFKRDFYYYSAIGDQEKAEHARRSIDDLEVELELDFEPELKNEDQSETKNESEV